MNMTNYNLYLSGINDQKPLEAAQVSKQAEMSVICLMRGLAQRINLLFYKLLKGKSTVAERMFPLGILPLKKMLLSD